MRIHLMSTLPPPPRCIAVADIAPLPLPRPRHLKLSPQLLEGATQM